MRKKLFSQNKFKSAKVVLFDVSYNSEIFTYEMKKEAFKDKKVIVQDV